MASKGIGVLKIIRLYENNELTAEILYKATFYFSARLKINVYLHFCNLIYFKLNQNKIVKS
jgi:hypothetical protein